MHLINCEVELILTWSERCIIIYTNIANQFPTFTIIKTNLCVPVVTLSTHLSIPNVEIKDYNVVIDGKNFSEQPIKNDKVTYENIRKIATGQGDDYTTGCLLDYI